MVYTAKSDLRNCPDIKLSYTVDVRLEMLLGVSFNGIRCQDVSWGAGSPPFHTSLNALICKYDVHFVASLLNGTEFETNGQDYLKTLDIVDAGCRSAKTGHPARI